MPHLKTHVGNKGVNEDFLGKSIREGAKWAGRHADRQADREADGQTDGRTDRQTGRQANRHTCVWVAGQVSRLVGVGG